MTAPITPERIQAALVTAARAVDLHGPVYAPVMDRLADELERARREASAPERARRILAALTDAA